MTCDKEQFASYKEGVQRLISLTKRRKGHKYGLYKCKACGFFHITTATKYMREQARQRKRHREDKYPLQIPAVVNNRKKSIQRKFKMIRNESAPLATQKMLTPIQVQILKHKINNGSHTI